MATAYKYVERKAEDNINWSQVGKEFSDMLGNEANRREEKKAEIDKSTRDYLNTLEDVQLGESDLVNTRLLNFAANLKETKLLQTTLLKSGQLKPREFNIISQNLTDGTKQALDVFNVYSEEFSKKMAMNDPALPYGEQASDLQNFLMESVEGFRNFTETAYVADPRTGLVSLAYLIDDPDNPDGPKIPDPNPNKLVSANNLTNRMRGTYRKYDVVTNASTYAETLGVGEYETILSKGGTRSAGTIQKIKSAMAKRGGISDMSDEERAEFAKDMGLELDEVKSLTLYEESRNKWIASQLDESIESTSGLSVLMDYLDINEATGEKYYPTFDADAAAGDPNAVLVIQKGNQVVSQLTEEQKRVASRALATAVDMSIDETETVKAQQFYSPPSQQEVDRMTAKEQRESVINAVSQLYSGNEKEKESAAQVLRSLNKNIESIKTTEDGVFVTFNDGTNQEPMRFGEMSGSEWVEGNTNFFLTDDNQINDVNEITKRTRDIKGKTTWEISSAGEVVTSTNNEERAQDLESAALIAQSDGDIGKANTLIRMAKQLRDTPNTQTVTTPGYVNETVPETGTGTGDVNPTVGGGNSGGNARQ